MISRVPDRGQIAAMNFNPQAGSEVGKRRPALVISPKLLQPVHRPCIDVPGYAAYSGENRH